VFIIISGFNTFALFAQTGKKKLTLEDVTKGYSFFPKSVYGIHSMSDGMYYSGEDEAGNLLRYNYLTGEVEDTLLSATVLKDSPLKGVGDYSLSDDEQKIMLYTNREQIYRYSFKADYYIYDRASGSLVPLSSVGKQQLAGFCPASANKAGFFRDNNLFIRDLSSEEELQITFDGVRNQVINGAPDWVYEEEFSFSKAWEWSPDGNRIAYIRFDESRVKEFNMTVYGGLKPALKGNALYPENRSWKYPKAGEDNSVVSVHVYDLTTGTTRTIDIGAETDIYIPRIKWTNDPAVLCIYRLNRFQNRLELLLADVTSGTVRVVYSDENPYYIDENNYNHLTFLRDNKHFIILNEKDGWNHIYLYKMDGTLANQVTKGEWVVTGFYGIDEREMKIYYQSAETSALNRDVYVINADGTGKKKLSADRGSNEAEFSSNFLYFINFHSSMTVPLYVTLNDSEGKLVRLLEDNQELVGRLKEYQFNYRELFTFTTSEGVELNGWMIRPPDFDKNKKYPVMMVQYSGPGSQEVLDEWGFGGFGWNNYLAQQGYIVVCTDGRGTGGRGEQFKKMTYLQLGKYETIDQIETARYMRSLPYVDPGRIGIWGWSYGGFITLSCLTKGEGIFKMGIAVAPVSNWKYYDNIYTERFMRKPQDNQAGYEDNAPINFASGLTGKLLIIHGTADDNVHVQNTLEFSEALVQAGKQFDMMLYTNRNHGIYGGNTRPHLYQKMTEYILDNL
jgi:dipeptidyl-peptidase-4